MRQPDWQSDDGRVTLFQGDCRDILPSLASVDAVVTDPPFGIKWGRATWDDSVEAYPELMRWVVSESSRIVTDGFCFVFQAMPNVARFHEWFPDGWRIFAACKNFAQIRPTGVWHSWDPVVFWKNGSNSGPNSRHVNRDYYVGNVAGVFRERAEHPCPKPLDTMEHISNLAAADGDVILDPFMGSGSTGVACLRTGRRFIGIEIDPKYFEIAKRRIKAELSQPYLIEPKETHEQIPLAIGAIE